MPWSMPVYIVLLLKAWVYKCYRMLHWLHCVVVYPDLYTLWSYYPYSLSALHVSGISLNLHTCTVMCYCLFPSFISELFVCSPICLFVQRVTEKEKWWHHWLQERERAMQVYKYAVHDQISLVGYHQLICPTNLQILLQTFLFLSLQNIPLNTICQERHIEL